MSLSPIVLFVYNRPKHTRAVLEGISNNQLSGQSELFIYCDGPKTGASDEDIQNIAEVRSIIREKAWCGKVHFIESLVNKGLAESLIGGITEVLDKYDKVIVLEDDIQLSPMAFNFLNAALDDYARNPAVMSVSAYMYPVHSTKLPEFFFLRMDSCWGWATWKRAWQKFQPDSSHLLETIIQSGEKEDFNLIAKSFYIKMLEDEKRKIIDSWAIRWYASIFVNKGLCLYPRLSYANNIGMDGSGTHSEWTSFYHNSDLNLKGADFHFPAQPDENTLARKEIRAFFTRLIDPTLFNRVKYYLKNLLAA